MRKSEKKKILILHTGGTFGQLLGEAGLGKKSPSYLNDLLQRVPELSSIAHIEMNILCNIDSSDASPELWATLAQNICSHWKQFDGFVVIHGTDTMAWSACALAFFLEKLTKPIVFTGSQRPLAALRSDARANLIDSVELATHGIPEVMLCFDSKIHKATCVTKYSNVHLHAFKSYNSATIGEFGVHIKVNPKWSHSIVPQDKRRMPQLNSAIDPKITTLVCVPGVVLHTNFIDSILESSKGIVVQGFGSGNLPLKNTSWKTLFEKALQKKIPVILTTQCEAGYVDLSLYENGRTFAQLGAVSAQNMTFEAASIKLMILLGRKIPFAKRHEFFSTPLAHECGPENHLEEQ